MNPDEIRKFKERNPNIPIFESTDIRTERLSWANGEAVIRDVGGCEYVFQKVGGRALDHLPVEFFSHELDELDVSDDEKLLAFVGKWGVSYSTLRKHEGLIYGYHDTCEGIREAIEKTNGLLKNGDLQIKLGAGTEFLSGGLVSLDECRITLSVLQRLEHDLFAVIRGEKEARDVPLNVINDGATSPLILHPRIYDASTGYLPNLQLTSAICNQILQVIADDSPWHECADEKCHRLFKTQRLADGSARSFRRGIPKYCSTTCEERAKKRRQRKQKSQPAAQQGGIG